MTYPASTFYEDRVNQIGWRTLRALIGAVGKDRFLRLVRDMQNVINPFPCQKCGTPVVNVAEGSLVDMRCPECRWTPVETRVIEGKERECLLSTL